MYLIVTKHGGLYLCERYNRESSWYILHDAYFVRRKRNISSFSKIELKSNSIAYVEKRGFRIEKETPWKTYNRICDYVARHGNVNEKIINRLTKVEAEKWK